MGFWTFLFGGLAAVKAKNMLTVPTVTSKSGKYEILSIKHRLNEIISFHTGKPIDTVAEDTDRDNFMDPAAAKEYGLIDDILLKREV